MTENVGQPYTFNPTVTELITEAYRDCNIIDETETPSAPQFEIALFRLRSLVQSLAATGIHVWTEEEAMIFLQKGIPEYLFPGLSTPTVGSYSVVAMACDADAWLQYELQSSYPMGTQIITLDLLPNLPGGLGLTTESGSFITTEGGLDILIEPVIGTSVGDNVGVVLDNGFIFWTTVAAVAGFQITLTDSLPSSASADNFVFSFPPSAAITRPLKIPKARLFTYQSATLIPMTVLSRQRYMDLPQPFNPGTPTQFYYSPQRGYGSLRVWPNVQQAQWGVRCTWYRPLLDLMNPNNTADFPQEWYTPLRWLTAGEIKVTYAVAEPRASMIDKQVASWTTTVAGWDRDSEDVEFGMDYRYR